MPTETKELDAVKDRLTSLIDDKLDYKEFKSGSRGFLLLSREEINGKKYMVNIQAVEVGSKDQS